MGTYYRYVNVTRREFVGLSDLRDGGDKERAAICCAPALVWLLLWPSTCGDGYRGRWRSYDRADDIRIVHDELWDDEMLNITPGLLQSMKGGAIVDIADDWHPRHEIHLTQRVASSTGCWRLADSLDAACSCGWRIGPIVGDDRERVLEMAVSAHVEA